MDKNELEKMMADPLFAKMRNYMLAFLVALTLVGMAWAFGALSWLVAAAVFAIAFGGAFYANRQLG